MHKIKVQQFEGPLDLLLQLIEDSKLEITTVSLAEVTDQYIKILHQTTDGKIQAAQLADFLTVAARLLLIKSRALLPFLQWEEDEQDGVELTKQLKIYKQSLEASRVIHALILKKRFTFSREKLLTGVEVSFAPPPKLTATKLGEMMREVIEGLKPTLAIPSDIIRRTINIQEKIQQIRDRIYQQATTKFSDILREAKNKTEVIVSFLALLELVKHHAVDIHQTKTFDDIVIQRAKNS